MLFQAPSYISSATYVISTRLREFKDVDIGIRGLDNTRPTAPTILSGSRPSRREGHYSTSEGDFANARALVLIPTDIVEVGEDTRITHNYDLQAGAFNIYRAWCVIKSNI